MTQNRFYWFAQIGGWTIYNLAEIIGLILIYPNQTGRVGYLLGTAIVNIIAGVSLTHFFRLIFKKYHWIRLPIYQLFIRCLFVTLLITFILAALNIPIDEQLIRIQKINWAIRDLSYILSLGKPVLIWMLIYVFYSYFNERKNDQIEKIKLQSSIKETEAKVLRAQMNPHFMFNALNSIRALIIEDPQRAQQGITQLSNILRSSLVADRRTTVSLKEELKTIEDYLALEKVRYEERLQVKWEIDESTLGVQVPPMMLQTLVENAIKHGVQKAIRWGFIEINTYRQDNRLVIKIRNTGQLESEKEHSDSSGFGLANTQQRLHLLYGDTATFRIFQEDELTVCAEITLPI